MQLYLQDWDDRYPYALDPSDKYGEGTWKDDPVFQRQLLVLPMISDAMAPMLKTRRVFRCPADNGFKIDDFTGAFLPALPDCFKRYGTSYFYRTELARVHASESRLQQPSRVNVLFDGNGLWHSSDVKCGRRFNTLFADSHVKSIGRRALLDLWALPL